MFNAWNPEIQYIGKLFVRIGAVSVAKSEIYPITSIQLVNKETIWKLFKEEEAILRREKPDMRNHRFSQKFEQEGPLLFEASFTDSYSKKSGFISFEVYEEARLREKREFLWNV